MNRPAFVLSALAAAGRDARFDPVQVQKYFFLLDKEIPHRLDGPHFDFRPHNFGPFDKTLYLVLEELSAAGEVEIDISGRYRRFTATESGIRRGEEASSALPDQAQSYMRRAADWVRSLTFRQLLSSIYEHYPEMAVNSALPQIAVRHPRALHFLPMPSFLRGMARTLDVTSSFDELNAWISMPHLDASATLQDWRAVGDDIEGALGKFECERERAP